MPPAPCKKTACVHFLSVVALLLLAAPLAAAAPLTSALWGETGEAWDPAGRLGDFSFAGYRSGEAPLPDLPVTARVTDFGAVPDDGGDDTAAFHAALEATASGALLVPRGRYVLTDRVRIRRPGVVLRGEGPGATVLFFPKGLEHIDPKPTQNTGGRPVSAYSWSDGFLGIQGRLDGEPVASVTAPARRGDRALLVDDTSRLAQGTEVLLEAADDEARSLVTHLYVDDPGNITNIPPARYRPAQVLRLTAIEGTRVLLDRPLRHDLRPEWKPTLRPFDVSVSESGIESLTIEFPARTYGGHFTEQGYNALALTSVRDCWVRDVEIVNADSGVHASAWRCTFDGLTFRTTADAVPHRADFGHHGITIGRSDNLVTRFDFRHRFIHDLTVSILSAGNVFSEGRGVDLCFDHHKRAPHGNLYTAIDVGAGTRPWASGGGADLGRHCAAWTVFWAIRSARPLAVKPGWSPAMVSYVGIPMEPVSVPQWTEPGDPATLVPRNLHQAQLQHRLKTGTE